MLSNPIASQIKLHEIYGGVVPEIASRMHVEAVDAMVDQALERAGCSLDDIDAIAVTQGPGLVGALLTGVAAAKALALGRELPLVAVNHIEGHVSANYIAHPELEPPFLCLVVSAGIRTWWWCATTAYTSWWVRPWTMRRARRLTRWRAYWGCRIREVPSSMRLRATAGTMRMSPAAAGQGHYELFVLGHQDRGNQPEPQAGSAGR